MSSLRLIRESIELAEQLRANIGQFRAFGIPGYTGDGLDEVIRWLENRLREAEKEKLEKAKR